MITPTIDTPALCESKFGPVVSKAEAHSALLHSSLSNLVDTFTEMERIATTRVVYCLHSLPVLRPSDSQCYRHSKHLWLLTIIYCLLLVGTRLTSPR